MTAERLIMLIRTLFRYAIWILINNLILHFLHFGCELLTKTANDNLTLVLYTMK